MSHDPRPAMDLLQIYFPDLDARQFRQLHRFHELILDWNTRLNLVSRKDIHHLETRHILHSLAIGKVFPFPSGSTILDVGTGGGFPGIPLAILFPGVKFTLIDSTGKKARAVREISTSLELSNVLVIQARAETLRQPFHFIVSRAVTRLDIFVGWIRQLVMAPDRESRENGILYLKGGDLGEELSSFPLARVYDLQTYFTEPFFETKKLIYLSFAAISG